MPRLHWPTKDSLVLEGVVTSGLRLEFFIFSDILGSYGQFHNYWKRLIDKHQSQDSFKTLLNNNSRRYSLNFFWKISRGSLNYHNFTFYGMFIFRENVKNVEKISKVLRCTYQSHPVGRPLSRISSMKAGGCEIKFWHPLKIPLKQKKIFSTTAFIAKRVSMKRLVQNNNIRNLFRKINLFYKSKNFFKILFAKKFLKIFNFRKVVSCKSHPHALPRIELKCSKTDLKSCL